MSMLESLPLPASNASPNALQKQWVDGVPYARFLDLGTIRTNGRAVSYQMSFREQHVGNPLLRTFHGGILASFGEIVAAWFVRESKGLEQEPLCSSMTFDYLRPAFAGITLAVPKIVRASKRFIVVSVDIFLDETIVSIGRFIYKR
jgi:acyl-CoA thioesterase